MGTQKKIIIFERCNFKQFGEEGLKLLQCLPQLPETSHLIFIALSLDKRLKVAQQLLKHANLKEFLLPPPWRTDAIAGEITIQAKLLQLRLTPDAINYLAQALGNDTIRIAAELNKLAVFANSHPLDIKSVKTLVPKTTQTSLQLATAMREGQTRQVAALLNDLLTRAEYPLAIVATLMTQFRTWLWVKAALEKGMKKDTEIAQLCGIGNPKRLYFIRQEVRGISLRSLTQSVTALLDLEVALKTHARAEALLPALLQITIVLVQG